MATGEILLDIVNGERQPLDRDIRLLVTVINGRQKGVFKGFVKGGSVRIGDLEVREDSADQFTVLTSAKAHADAGFMPVGIEAGQPRRLELMMLRRDPVIAFEPFSAIEGGPRRAELLAFLCGGATVAEARATWDRLAADERSRLSLSCLLNVAAALEQMTLLGIPATGTTPAFDPNPLKAFKALARPPAQDRIFAWADARLLAQVRDTAARRGANALSRFAAAPAALHPGATGGSFKQTDFGEANVQFSFHPDARQVSGVECTLVEVDIDYFKDSAAHLLLEVFPNTIKSKIQGKDSAASLTDPHKVYGLRWIAGRRLGREFNPPYVLH